MMRLPRRLRSSASDRTGLLSDPRAGTVPAGPARGLSRRACASLLTALLWAACGGGGGVTEGSGTGGGSGGGGGGGGSGGGGGGGSGPTQRWSDPLTWAGGVLPGPNDNVSIAPGQTVILDVATPPLDCLRIEGTLVADPLLDVAVTANCIEVMQGGTFQIGTSTQPHERLATITLKGPRGTHTARTEDNALDNDGVQRSLRVMDGGTLRLFGATPPLLKTKLNAHANAGATTLQFADAVNWRAGDRIAVSLTDFFGVGQTEILTLAADCNGTTATTTSGLQSFRWGRLQYPIDTPVGGSAMSLVPGTFTPASPTTPTVLDERAEVVNLTRRLVIQGADDADWANHGFGAHVMVMGLQSVAQVRGVEFRRGGQRRAMGRYPFHWHMLSYTSAGANGQGGGTYLGDAASNDHFLADSSVWNSQNRAVTIHGTCGVTVDNVYAVDIRGHAFFMEDGNERRNTIRDCVAMRVRDPGQTNRLKVHDGEASGFWLTNPDNTIIGNSGSDCSGRGLWNSFATRCFGLSRNTPVQPAVLNILQFEDNTGHSNQHQGIMTDMVVVDEAGNTATYRYGPGLGQPFVLRANKVWKNRNSGYVNRVVTAHYLDWTAADNDGFDFSGQADVGSVMDSPLLVGFSLNSATPLNSWGTGSRRMALASYHFLLEIRRITAVNYPLQSPVQVFSNVFGGGVFASNDTYTHSVALGHARNPGWRLINSSPGYLNLPPYFDGFPLSMGGNPERFRYWTLSGAYLDPYGYWGPAGNYLVPNVTFFTHALANATPVANQGHFLTTPELFYGIGNIVLDNEDPFNSLVPLRAGRLDTNNTEIAHQLVGDPAQSAFLPNMRHFALAKGGRYRITIPSGRLPSTGLRALIDNAYRSTDHVLIGVPWPGTGTVSGFIDATVNRNGTTANNTRRNLSFTGTSIASVLADPTGVTAWRDTANNTVWVRIVGGLALTVPNGNSDAALAQSRHLVLQR